MDIASDTKHLKSFEDYYYGLRLDYTDTKFHISKNSCGVIRFKSKEVVDNIIIPKGGGNVPKLVILQFHQNNKMIINKNKTNTPTNINHTLPHFYSFCKKLKP